MNRWVKSDWLILIGLVFVAAFFRLWRLSAVPPGFQFDEAYNATDALRVLAGERPLFFEANGGREALHIYAIAPFVAIFGATAFALRLASALIGIVTVALSYVCWRKVLPDSDRAVAALSALLMAISYWHIHFSRYGIRAILMPLLLIGAFYFLWSATESQTKREWVMARAAKNWRATAQTSFVPLILCGLFVGLSLYAHPAARFIPVIIVIWLGYRMWLQRPRTSSVLAHFAPLQRGRLRLMLQSLLLIGASALIVFLPLGLYFLNHPDSFFGHPTVVAITDQHVSEGNIVNAFAINMLHVAGMFFISGDAAWIHNLSGRPVFDGVIALFFLVGLVVWGKQIAAREPVAIFLLIWIPIMLLPTLLSDAAPNFSRAIGIMPAIFLIPAWGMAFGLNWFTEHAFHNTSSGLRVVCSVSVLCLSAFFSFNDYFNQFPSHPETYIAFDVNKLDAAQHLQALAQSDRIYLPPLWSQHATFALLTRDASFKSFDNGEVVVLPARDPQKGMVYAFPAEADPAYVQEFERTYGALARQQLWNNTQGQPLLIEYHIAPADIPADATALPAGLPIAPQRIVNANFNNEIQFIGYRVVIPQSPSRSRLTNGGDGREQREQPYQLTLVWQARQSITQDYTLFIHLNDASGKRIAQRDRRPGNGSYPTTVWSAGDIVVETYEMFSQNASGPPLAPRQTGLQFAVGWYRRADGARLPVLDASGHVLDDKIVFNAEATQ